MMPQLRALQVIALCVAQWGVLGAGARPVPTGQAHRLGRGWDDPVRVYWANTTSDQTATIQLLPGHTVRGDRYDLVDQRGFLGRAIVEVVDEVKCGERFYQRAQVRFVAPIRRQAVGQIVALYPILKTPGAARVLAGGAAAQGFPAARNAMVQIVDLDGDRRADVARQQNGNCRTAGRTEPASCFETWARKLGAWRLVARVEMSCR
jgi:hypothetical protein